MKYLNWKIEKIDSNSPSKIEEMYSNGFVFTRIDKNIMHQTRSVRMKLADFDLSSENKRILKKVENVEMKKVSLPLPLASEDNKNGYNWSIGKMAKDFYETKFGSGIMSAQKIKEILTDGSKSNFNSLLTFDNVNDSSLNSVGYVICYENSKIMHYSYPFYDLKKIEDIEIPNNSLPKSIGLGMMTKAVLDAKNRGLEYVYLGSLQRPSDVYKLQFKGMEWFDGEKWETDLYKVKNILLDKTC
ncbi:MAG: hypothetical protein Q7R78_02835 [bacterium]|nr:hypothetical protein [bacterium]